MNRYKYIIGFIGSLPVLLGIIPTEKPAVEVCEEWQECGYYPVRAFFSLPPGTRTG